MSTYADPSKATVWLDGDVFRAPLGTSLPADIFASSLSGWEAYGGLEIGFSVERPQEITKYSIFNASGTYKTRKGQEEPVLKLRAVDLSKATTLTLLTGGSIVAANGGFKWLEGAGEEFALIARVNDSVRKRAYVQERTELGNRPTDTLNDAQLMGWEFELNALTPVSGNKSIYAITSDNPLA